MPTTRGIRWRCCGESLRPWTNGWRFDSFRQNEIQKLFEICRKSIKHREGGRRTWKMIGSCQAGQASRSMPEGRHNLLGEQAQGAQRLRAGEGTEEEGANEVVRAGDLQVFLHLLFDGIRRADDVQPL